MSRDHILRLAHFIYDLPDKTRFFKGTLTNLLADRTHFSLLHVSQAAGHAVCTNKVTSAKYTESLCPGLSSTKYAASKQVLFVELKPHRMFVVAGAVVNITLMTTRSHTSAEKEGKFVSKVSLASNGQPLLRQSITVFLSTTYNVPPNLAQWPSDALNFWQKAFYQNTCDYCYFCCCYLLLFSQQWC